MMPPKAVFYFFALWWHLKLFCILPFCSVRYYMDNSSTIEELERSLLLDAHNVKLWMKLAYKKLYEDG